MQNMTYEFILSVLETTLLYYKDNKTNLFDCHIEDKDLSIMLLVTFDPIGSGLSVCKLGDRQQVS